MPVRSLESQAGAPPNQPQTISELAARTGVSASAIRYWERVGGRRRNGPEALRLIAALQLAQQCGFTRHETRQLLHGSSWQELAHRKLQQLDATQAILSRVANCECVNLKECRQLSSTA